MSFVCPIELVGFVRPIELVGFVRPRELVSFDRRLATLLFQSKNVLELGVITRSFI